MWSCVVFWVRGVWGGSQVQWNGLTNAAAVQVRRHTNIHKLTGLVHSALLSSSPSTSLCCLTLIYFLCTLKFFLARFFVSLAGSPWHGSGCVPQFATFEPTADREVNRAIGASLQWQICRGLLPSFPGSFLPSFAA